MDQTRSSYHHGDLRRALIDAGLEMTRTSGASGLVLRDVTRRVGVSPNAAYRHFADRDSLRAAVVTRIQEGMVERMLQLEPAAQPGMSAARARLTAVGLGYIAFALAEPGWFDVAFAGPDAFSAAAFSSPADTEPDAAPAPLAFLHDALDGLVETGELEATAREGAEWPCWSAVHGFALLALRGPLRSAPATVVNAAAQRTVDAVITGIVS